MWPSQGDEAALKAMNKHVEAFPEDQQAAAYLILIASSIGDWAVIDRMTAPSRLSQFPLRENIVILATAAAMRYPTSQNKHFLLEMMKARIEKLGAMDCGTFTMASLIGIASEAYDSFAHFPIGPKGAKGEPLGLMGYRTHLLFTPVNKLGREDPRFDPIDCARLGLVEYWLETGSWPDCVDEVPYDFRAACHAARDMAKDRFDY
jgi:hypothetical protein